ncbi:MAG: hypothetical protein LPJ98_16445 [Cyclobacteriaceae bacterium]|nr:hypothetical protein [Cyclobacteriaceae bacterium]
MKNLFTLLLIVFGLSANAQQEPVSGTITGYNLPELDMVLFSLGMDNPIKLTTVQKDGTFSLEASNVKLPEVSADTRSMFMGQLYHSFYFSFFSNDFDPFDQLPALKGGYLGLFTEKNQWAGTVFPVSSEEVMFWLEDPGYNNAVKGSFWDLIYVEEDISLDFPIASSMYYDDKEVPVHYQFNLELRPGFNWVQYDIEEVYETDPNIIASFPIKITIRNIQDASKMHWIGKYF